MKRNASPLSDRVEVSLVDIFIAEHGAHYEYREDPKKEFSDDEIGHLIVELCKQQGGVVSHGQENELLDVMEVNPRSQGVTGHEIGRQQRIAEYLEYEEKRKQGDTFHYHLDYSTVSSVVDTLSFSFKDPTLAIAFVWAAQQLIGKWWQARSARKIKIKIGTVQIEATGRNDIENLTGLAEKILAKTQSKSPKRPRKKKTPTISASPRKHRKNL